MQLACRMVGNPHNVRNGIRCIVVTLDHRPVMHGRAVEQPLGRFADDYEIKLCSARVGKALRRIGISADGPYPGIKLVDVAKPQMWRNSVPFG